MKNFLRKLHIGDSAGDGASSPAPHPPPSSRKGGGGGGGAGAHHEPAKHASGISSWLSSVAGRPHPPPPVPASAAELALASSLEERRAEDEEAARRDSRNEGRKREIEKQEKQEVELEEYHMQLALEMSAREDPEAVQIEVTKQISLGSCPLQSTAAEVLAFRYWSFSALSYDDKILDGFYDVWVTGGKPAAPTIPSLVELQEQPFSHGAKTEAVLVSRAQDSELVELGHKALVVAADFRSQTSHYVGRVLIQRLAILVANHMGGPVFNPENVLLKYQNMSNLLRASIRSAVIPLGSLTLGLARHRALLFKVLADNLDVPCRLVKGRQYTGSDDGALNIVKLNDGREYIVDLMSDPGTLIPSDGADLGKEFEESSFAGNHHGDKDDDNTQLESSVSEASSPVYGSFENESKGSTPTNAGHSDPYGAITGQTRNQGSLQSSSYGEVSVGSHASESLPIIHESRSTDHTGAVKNKEKPVAANKSSSSSPSSSAVGSSPAVRRTKVKDVSEYMISAAKDNPQLAEKIHAVLLENGVVPPPDLFSEESREQPKDLIVYDTSLFQTKGEMIKRMNELESTSHDESDHGPSLLPHHVHEHQTKAVPFRMPLDLKPVQGMGVYQPLNFHDNTNPSLPLYEPSALAREYPFQLIKQMPVTAAAVATAAVVASSMVVAAAKSNSDVRLDVPVAAAATAAAVVATSAAVKQYEYLEPGCQLFSLPSSSEANGPVHRVRHDLWNKDQLEIDHGQENSLEHGDVLVDVPQEAERISDKSIGTESVRSDITMDDVAEFEIQWEEITLGERVGLGSFGEVYRGEWHGT
ncbi:hypothetical protein ACQ4PT_011562 [Festuca glaucescens]